MGCVAALGLFAASAAAAETIVVKSAGPSAKGFPPGKSLPDASRVSLKAGDVVTILDGRGTRVLRGPGVFSTTVSTATSTSIGSVLKNTGSRQVRTGAVRGVTSAPPMRPSNVWLVDTSKSGTICYAGTEGLSAWAPAHAQETTYTITRTSDGKTAPLTFRAGQSTKPWPMATLPVESGKEYRVSGGSLTAPISLRFASLGTGSQGLEQTAAGMIKAGCNSQLDLLIEMVAVPASEEPNSG
jgi:phage-related tail fiber protein